MKEASWNAQAAWPMNLPPGMAEPALGRPPGANSCLRLAETGSGKAARTAALRCPNPQMATGLASRLYWKETARDDVKMLEGPWGVESRCQSWKYRVSPALIDVNPLLVGRFVRSTASCMVPVFPDD